ncbi:MAG: HflK protein [Candidatus Schekmanbacteria bacterium RBG_13_48_7]|uniref:Protein HflK n=1 Tax=Candidatus Schekmanbacteria bacterium RBG_13_48_7 TaxID=1817878 RepID=A0A1F7S027_9BACT|nr:MAG: HflK protein [Candidatus Schekmanbacteria bacterium RBG_13_48_7]
MTKQEKVSIIAILINLFLTVNKFILASYTNSIALLAEAYHSFADILSSFLVFAALVRDRRTNSSLESGSERQKSGTQNSKSRIFTPGGWENKVALSIGVFLFIVAIGIIGKVRATITPNILHPLTAAIFIGFMALCSYILYRFELQVGTSTKSPALTADAHHAKTDMLASIFIICVFIAEKYGIRIDRPAGLLIGIYILINAGYVLTQGIRAYISAKKGKIYTGGMVYEEVIINYLSHVFHGVNEILWKYLWNLCGSKNTLNVFKQNVVKGIPRILIILIILIYLSSGFFILRSGEHAIVERFGEPMQMDDPLTAGLHYHYPWPIERVKKLNVDNIRRLSIGYIPKYAGDLILWTNAHYVQEFPILTGENSFLDIAMHIHYRIKNLYQFLYTSTDPDKILEQFGYLILTRDFGSGITFSILTDSRDDLEELMKRSLQDLMNTHQLGIEIIEIAFRDIHPPTDVASSFEDVVSAQEDYETFIEEAHGYKKDLIPRARGSSFRNIKVAESYTALLVEQSKGQAESFSMIHKAFAETKEISRYRMILESLEESLSGITKYVLLPQKKGASTDMYFYLESEGWKEQNQPEPSSSFPTTSSPKDMSTIRSEEDMLDIIEQMQKLREKE